MTLLNEGVKRGVKMFIIDVMDYEDFKQIGDAMLTLGYKSELLENGGVRFYK